MRLVSLKILLVTCLLTVASYSLRADVYPTRTVTVVVGFPPGGGTDVAARIVGKKLEERLGKPVVIENRSGSAGQLALGYVAKSPADGHSLVLGSSATMSMAYGIHREKLPYNPNDDFVPLARVADVPFVLVVNPDIPVKSITELVAYAKQQSQPLTIATSGPGSTHHLYGELLNELTGMKMLPVPYRGSIPAVTDVVAGHVPLMFVDLPASLPLIREGKLRAIGVSTKARLEAAPDILSLAEAGVPEFDAASWFIILAPRDTPQDVVARLHNEFRSIMGLPDVRRGIIEMGMVPVVSAPIEELKTFIRSETTRWTAQVERLGLRQ